MATSRKGAKKPPAKSDIAKLDRKAKSNKKLGRPSVFDGRMYHIILELVKRGKTYEEIASICGVSKDAISHWRAVNPNFKKDMDLARSVADDMVENALFQSAIGFNHMEEKVHFDKFGQVHTYETIKQYPPDVNACRFWLTNRRASQWSNKDKVESNGNVVVTLAYDPNKRLVEGSGGTDRENEEQQEAG